MSQALALTQTWIKEFIIKESICPFAAAPYSKNAIQYSLSPQLSFPETIHDVISICMQMRSDPSINTAFYLIENLSYEFEDLIDLNLACTDVLVESGLESEFQLVSFHPDFVFEGVKAESTVHFTNRSPYPMLHILREADVTKAVDQHGEISSILENNKATTQRLFRK